MYSQYECASPETAQASISVVVETCLGMNVLAQDVFNIHPNPTTDELTIEFRNADASSKSISICDVLGRQMYEKENVRTKNLRIDISSFLRSIYFVRITDNEKEYLQKVVVE